MPIATILRDNREQRPYDFDGYSVEVEDATLRTGDYSIAELCDRDEENDTYVPFFAVERKSGQDFLSSITTDRKRFKNEIDRADKWEDPLEVVVEEPWTTFVQNIGIMNYRDIHPNQVTGTVEEWTDYYNVNFHFVGDRIGGEKKAFDLLTDALRRLIRTRYYRAVIARR